MAHRTNLIQVSERLESPSNLEVSRDPICGVERKRRDFKTILFRRDQTVYFCSRECLNQFLHSASEKKMAA